MNKVIIGAAVPVFHNVAVHGKGRICPNCRKVDPEPWENPLLVTLKKLGAWKGTTFGGPVVCDACEPQVAASLRARHTDQSPFSATHIPREYGNATWDRFEKRDGTEVAVETAQEWYVAQGDHLEARNLYIHGGVGAGKTLLSCILAALWWRDRSKRVLFQTTTDLFDRLRQAEFTREDAPLFTLDHLADRNLLVLDDLGAEKPTEYTCARLLALLERRHEANLPTIITSNLDLDDLGQRLGDDRVPSRLAHWSEILVLRAMDYRAEAAIKRKRARERKR